MPHIGISGRGKSTVSMVFGLGPDVEAHEFPVK